MAAFLALRRSFRRITIRGQICHRSEVIYEESIKEDKWGEGLTYGRGRRGPPVFLKESPSDILEAVEEELKKPLHPNKFEIDRRGHVYLPYMEYRRSLCEIFGVGGWHLIPVTDVEVDPGGGNNADTQRVSRRDFALVVKQICLAKASAEVEFTGLVEENIVRVMMELQNKALATCCRDIGMAHQLTLPDFVSHWRAENAESKEEVVGDETKTVWRKIIKINPVLD